MSNGIGLIITLLIPTLKIEAVILLITTFIIEVYFKNHYKKNKK